VLKAYVDNTGMVDHRGLKANRGKLDAFARELAELPRAAYDRWSDRQKVAFWINAYNALTLQVIIDNYPIKSGFFASLKYPKNSIRQISGVWDKITFPVMGKRMTLEGMEPYEVEKLDEQSPSRRRRPTASPRPCRLSARLARPEAPSRRRQRLSKTC